MPDMVVACHPGPAACRATAATGHPCLPGRLALNPSAPQHHAHTIMPGPWWEARFEPRSYGFRPGRSCQDAIAAIFWTVAGRRTKRRWVLDADLTAAFDRVGHDHILDQLGTFPAKAAVAGSLRPNREPRKEGSQARCCSTLPCTVWSRPPAPSTAGIPTGRPMVRRLEPRCWCATQTT